jgi:hypothetical protein
MSQIIAFHIFEQSKTSALPKLIYSSYNIPSKYYLYFFKIDAQDLVRELNINLVNENYNKRDQLHTCENCSIYIYPFTSYVYAVSFYGECEDRYLHSIIYKLRKIIEGGAQGEQELSITQTQTISHALDKLLVDAQDSKKIMVIDGIQEELDQTKEVLYKTIEKIFERQDKLEDLLEKSERLSENSKIFLQGAKKMNTCCVII